jgi:lysophospholipid acyltransferase (LPLAT)-like uncharacterized protein
MTMVRTANNAIDPSPNGSTAVRGAKRMLMRFTAQVLGVSIKSLVATLDTRIVDYEPNCDASLREFRGQVIYVLWHEYFLLPTAMTGGCNLTLLIGMHPDADWLGEIAASFGFDTVRGSSTKGGIKAILKYVREHRDTCLVMTPDGPKGPRRVLSSGCIQLASLLQIPIVPAGVGFDRPYRSRSWDRFAIPRLGSRGRFVLGPRITIPRKLSESQVLQWRMHVESVLHQVSDEAESWALDGIPRAGERGMYHAPHASLERTTSLGLVT